MPFACPFEMLSTAGFIGSALMMGSLTDLGECLSGISASVRRSECSMLFSMRKSSMHFSEFVSFSVLFHSESSIRLLVLIFRIENSFVRMKLRKFLPLVTLPFFFFSRLGSETAVTTANE